jgi:alcohol dehydrogenase
MPLESFDHDPRTRVVFGLGTIGRLGELARELGARKALLVTDSGIVQAGHAARALESLHASGVEAVVYSRVEENPTTLHVDAGVAAARAQAIDSIIGLGGGSSMDCGKGINFLLTSGGVMKDYWGLGKAKGPMLPFIAVPTTAGTGSESQSFALISDSETHQKMACGDKRAAARVAILDPELTVTQPRAVAAATGIDAVSHAIETFVTTRRTPYSRMLSLEAWRLLGSSFERVLEAPRDVEARSKMLLGASLAGAAIEGSMLGATHAAANPLTARFGVVHGHAIGLLLPHVVRFNAGAVGDEYRALAGSPEDLARRLESMYASTGLPRRLRDYGVSGTDIPQLADEARTQWTAQFNPRPVSDRDFMEIYQCAL